MENKRDAQFFALPAPEVLTALEVDAARGLAREEISRRRQRFGANQLEASDRTSWVEIVLHQFKSVIVWLLATASGFALYLGDLAEAIAIIVVLMINFVIGFVTELRANRSMEALRKFARVKSRVRRHGQEITIDAEELVPGDLVLLEEGDVVTADLRLIQSSGLHCDESVLTGESHPVAKSVDTLAPDLPLADRVNMAFKGTSVTRGRAEGVVVATGMATELGRISDLVQKAEAKVAPLERRLDRLGHRLIWLTLALALITVLAGLLRGHALTDMIQTGVALAVAAVPEGLPVVATLTLARGMWRMAAHNALISNMPSVETLGATTVILTDKTGTLTQNRMAAVRYILAQTEPELGEGIGGAPNGALLKAMQIGLLCNAASLESGTDGAPAPGDPMERALLLAARDAGIDLAQTRHRYPEVDQHPFDADLKMMATVHDTGHGILVAIKGAPEAVLQHCVSVLGEDGETRVLDQAELRRWTGRAEAAAQEGLRLLALAFHEAADCPETPFGQLTLAGIVCLRDPIRPNVPDALLQTRKAGVRVVMVTGDHARTAAAIATAAGLGEAPLNVIERDELARTDLTTLGEEDRRKLLDVDIFARVEPITKLHLVRLYQDSGEIVAMTGDGVNDAPALKKADIGIAMGLRGTEVAREAADMVLKDDNFATIVTAMRQGRVILDNIRTFVVYLMSCNVSEILVVGLAIAAGLPAPLLPLQILFLNLITDVFPAFALGLGQGDDRIMERPPRDPAEPIVTRGHWLEIGLLGVLITALTLLAFILALYWLKLGTEGAVTVSFLTLALAQLWNVFNMRAPGSPILVNEVTGNRTVWGAIALCIGLLAAALWIPELALVLDLADPGAAGLMLAGGMSSLQFILGTALVGLNIPRRLGARTA